MIGKPEDKLLKSFTGLEGGVVTSGSTCGVVSGGAMGLALSHHDEIMEKGIPAQAGLLALVGEYVKWFEDNFGTSFCRERSIECQTITGQRFSDWSDFQDFISSSDKCSGLIEFAKGQASIAVEKCA